MRELRSASTSPRSKPLDMSNMSISNRTLRSSISHGPPDDANTSLQVCQSPIHKRKWSSFSSDSSSSSIDSQDSPFPSVRDNARRKKQARGFLLPPPPSSPEACFDSGGGIAKYASYADSTTILSLPVEVHQHICKYLPSDRDIANYSETCSRLKECVTYSVWRQRFLCVFDPIIDAAPKAVYEQYAQRRRLSQLYVEFDDGRHPIQPKYLSVLRDLILQSNAYEFIPADGMPRIMGFNHDFIRQLVVDAGSSKTRTRGTNLLHAICNTEALFSRPTLKYSRCAESLVLVIQLSLLHLSLNPLICSSRASRFNESQEQVYKCYKEEPIFKGKSKGELNLPWLLHVANFFKFHFKQPDGEGMLAHVYGDLDESELPRPWCGKLRAGTQQLGKRWKGAFAYLNDDDLALIRTSHSHKHRNVVDETNEGNNGFQDLTIFFDINDYPELLFNDNMESVVHGNPAGPIFDPATKSSRMPKVKDFFGLGYDGVSYHFNGRLHELPAQQGIPGFQRVTMIKYLPDEDGNYGFGQTSGWAYEGCVLPGNEIMIGRWWRIEPDPTSDDESYSGPFIFWRVEGSAEDKVADASTAIKFLDSIGGLQMW